MNVYNLHGKSAMFLGIIDLQSHGWEETIYFQDTFNYKNESWLKIIQNKFLRK